MAEPIAGGSPSMPALTRCPWCSAELPDPNATTCPSCSANLTAEGEPQVPGVTAIDIEKIALRRTSPPKKSRLMALITGDMDYEPEVAPVAAPGSLEPPPLEVRREILRLEMEARLADLTAEAGAMAADEALEAKAEGEAATAAGIRAESDAVATTDSLTPAPAAGSGAGAESAAADRAAGDSPAPTHPDAPKPASERGS